MDIFDILSLLGGLSFFLFGMQLMGGALEKKAGGRLGTALEKMTQKPLPGFLLGMGVTAVIQSSSATTVMVVGFVNSGILTLARSVYIIMGANIGTTITAWVLSLTGLSGEEWYIQLFKPSSFVPLFAVAGIIFYLFIKNEKYKETGLILLGFATLMTGMSTMSDSVSGLKDVPEFSRILTLFSNPVLGVVSGAVLTAIIQSSSASVGILQALSSTGAITLSSAVPIIMGQNIGTCVTAMISSVGASLNAKRAALVHLYFNLGGTAVLLTAYYLLRGFHSGGASLPVDSTDIALVHTVFNVLCTAVWLPFVPYLEKLAKRSFFPKEKYLLKKTN